MSPCGWNRQRRSGTLKKAVALAKEQRSHSKSTARMPISSTSHGGRLAGGYEEVTYIYSRLRNLHQRSPAAAAPDGGSETHFPTSIAHDPPKISKRDLDNPRNPAKLRPVARSGDEHRKLPLADNAEKPFYINQPAHTPAVQAANA
jgi:hypothetical protein